MPECFNFVLYQLKTCHFWGEKYVVHVQFAGSFYVVFEEKKNMSGGLS